MKEDLLHHLWKFRNFSAQVQYTSTGQRVEIIHPGMHNHDAGPDFFNARIRIDNLEWAGNVEIHVKSSDWVVHGHSSDRAYDNVILHVVYDDDKPERLKNSTFPTLQIKNHIDPSVVEKYNALVKNQSFVPCAAILEHNIFDKILINSYLERLYIEKIECKSKLITNLLEANDEDWDETLYQLLARSFGLGKNRLPFELLVRSLPVSLIIQEKSGIESVEALFFGQAGFLNAAPKDAYTALLQGHYEALKLKYGLQAIDAHLWKFSRIRPGNFPTLRIAQFAALFYQNRIRFKHFMEAENLACFYELFQVKASDYWAEHSKFGRKIEAHSTRLGDSAVESILINAVLPVMFVYGRIMNRPDLEERAMKLMGQIRGETNAIVKEWKDLGFSACSALESQALLHLKKEYCDRKKCLSCAIGTAILEQSS